jgi:hypothetical protein
VQGNLLHPSLTDEFEMGDRAVDQSKSGNSLAELFQTSLTHVIQGHPRIFKCRYKIENMGGPLDSMGVHYKTVVRRGFGKELPSELRKGPPVLPVPTLVRKIQPGGLPPMVSITKLGAWFLSVSNPSTSHVM